MTAGPHITKTVSAMFPDGTMVVITREGPWKDELAVVVGACQDSWNAIVRRILKQIPWCWVYFYAYIAVAVFVLMNLVSKGIMEHLCKGSNQADLGWLDEP